MKFYFTLFNILVQQLSNNSQKIASFPCFFLKGIQNVDGISFEKHIKIYANILGSGTKIGKNMKIVKRAFFSVEPFYPSLHLLIIVIVICCNKFKKYLE